MLLPSSLTAGVPGVSHNPAQTAAARHAQFGGASAFHAGGLATPTANAAIAPVLREDLAAAIATVLTEAGHENRAYELTAPTAITIADLARLASEVAGEILHRLMTKTRRARG